MTGLKMRIGPSAAVPGFSFSSSRFHLSVTQHFIKDGCRLCRQAGGDARPAAPKHRLRKRAALIALSCLLATPALASSLKIGLNADPDSLDPVISRSLVGRTVMEAFCDKLVDISPSLEIVPKLATAWSWSPDGKELTMTLRSGVVFQDGEAFDAAAVKFNLDRDVNFPGSNRRSELPSFKSVEVIDPLTVRITLDQPFAPLVGVLTDRAGMMLSPKAASAPGADMSNHPVCAGPYRVIERVPQDRIVVERFDRYWNKDHFKLDRITYLPVPDTTVRLANLQSGDLDLIEAVLPTDLPAIEADPRLATASAPELGYVGITFNLANGPAAKTPLGSDARVRQAFELSLDRDAINTVIFGGQAIVDNQFVLPSSPYHDAELKSPPRDLAKAKALLQAAGVPNPVVTMLIGTSPEQQQLAQMVQAMAEEAGFQVKLQAIEFASGLAAAQRGDFQATLATGGWSGRIDPDGNIYPFIHSGGALNDAHYENAEVDRLLDAARVAPSLAERKPLYDQMQAITLRDLPLIYLYHRPWIWAFAKTLHGFTAVPDGVLRVTDLTKS
jgi:peptide/nickel transport system substrate-binding protein